MSQNNGQSGGNYYVLFILFLVLYGTIAPVIYTVVFSYLESYYFSLDLMSPDSFAQGNWFTLCATLLMLHAAYLFRPTAAYKMDTNRYESVYFKYRYILFYSAILALCIDIVLNLFYGRAQSSLTSLRSPIAVYLGYFSRGFSQSASLIILFPLLLYRRIDRFAFIVILLVLMQSITSWSRSALFDICFFILLGLAYSTTATRQMSLKKVMVILMAGVIAIILGDIGRGAPAFQVVFEVLPRFYQNNQTLYLAVENPGKVYEILTDGQPRVLLQQLFSFAIERTEYPSSARLIEYWGGSISPDERGHVAGYAYGWLGLTFGLLGWYGLIAVYIFFLFVFALLRAFARRTTFVNIVFFTYFAGVLFEFFQNLGLDSFLEKIFKGFLYTIVYILVIKMLGSLASRRPGRKEVLKSRVREAVPGIQTR